MRIGIVGGLDRNESQFRRQAAAAGHEVECHYGHLSGPGVAGLKSLVERADMVVIVTDVNSHAAVIMARRLARSMDRPVLLQRRLGRTQLATLLRSGSTLQPPPAANRRAAAACGA
jgi:hypothetical protein